MHSKELFNDVIKNTVSPFLKKAGFKKNGLNYHRRQGNLCYIINFQNDTYNTHWRTRFYVNCGIHSYEVDDILQRPQKKDLKSDDCYFNKRIESITESFQQFYDLTEDSNIEDVIIYLMNDLQKLVKYYNTIDTTETLMELLLVNKGLQEYEEVLLYLIKTNKMHRMGDYAKKMFSLKTMLENRWDFFEKRVNIILSDSNITKRLEDYLEV